jgi:phosphatidylethanolamine-binding protein (PEBP) family uncharacterized protein
MLRSFIALCACAWLSAADGFALTSPEVVDGGTLPTAYTGDGEGATLPLAWSGAPAGTAGYALIMHHLDREGRAKWYWVLHGIPATTTALPRNASGIGTIGTNSIDRQARYAPPRSKGPGSKTYVYSLYALSASPRLAAGADAVGQPELLAAMEGLVLGCAELRVVYTRTAATGDQPPAPPQGPAGDPPANGL